jgi:hypothetical protein
MLIYLSTRLRRAKLSAQKMFFRYAAPLPLRPSILLGIQLQAHRKNCGVVSDNPVYVKYQSVIKTEFSVL